MKTIVLEQPGLLRLTDTPAPDGPGEGMALVRVHRVGICGTDLHAFEGTQPFFSYPRILGHELGVEVVTIGRGCVGDLTIGDSCAVNPYLNCGQCSACRRGKTNCCERLQVLGVHTDGGMRELIAVPAANLHKAARLSLDQLALVEMLCIGAHAVQRATLDHGEIVLVIGAGPIGLGVMRFAQLAGANVLGMEVSPARIEFARRQLGVEHWIEARNSPETLLRESLAGELPTVVFDATGNHRSMIDSFNYVGNGGKLIFVGLHQGEVAFKDAEFHRREMTLLASRNATNADFANVVAAMQSGQIDPQPWISQRVEPAELSAALPGWLKPRSGFVKGMLHFD